MQKGKKSTVKYSNTQMVERRSRRERTRFSNNPKQISRAHSNKKKSDERGVPKIYNKKIGVRIDDPDLTAALAAANKSS